jgi:hypothetical protein
MQKPRQMRWNAKKKIGDARMSRSSECHSRMFDVVQLVDFDIVLVGSGVAADEELEFRRFVDVDSARAQG